MPNLLSTFSKYSRQTWWLAVILITIVVYIPLWNNGFVNWDDNVYLSGNPLILDSWAGSFARIFSSSFEGHYHPLTLLSLKADYSLFGLNPKAFHLHNLLLHLLNCYLVYRLFLLITEKPMVAGITALLFGIHPMHVESVAWASARKDVLFMMWFLMAFILWLKFESSRKKGYLSLSLLAFLLSILSKGQAVFLPLCLIGVDVLRGRSLFSREIWLEKLPYFALALVLGAVAIYVQGKTGYTTKSGASPGIFEMMMIAGFAFSFYLLKIILPFHLSAYYSYPAYEPGHYPAGMWLGLLLFLAVLCLVIYSYRNNRILFFGLMLFIVNIFVFLKWIPVSNYIIADRYTYVSALGFFFLAAWALERLRHFGKAYALGSGLLVVVMLWTYALFAFSRVPVWKNTDSLMNDILLQYPDVYTALNARGVNRLSQGDLSGAMQDFTHALSLQPNRARAYANIADIFARTNHDKEALADLDKALQLEPGNAAFHNNRGLCREKENLYPEALDDFNAAIKADPGSGIFYANRGKILNRMGKFSESLEDLKRARSLGAKLPFMAFETGIAYYNLKDFNRAVMQFNQALEQDPAFTNALFYRGFSNYNLGDFVSAEADLSRALDKDDRNALAWAMRGLARTRLGDKPGACNDFYKAKELGLVQADKEIEKNCR